MLLFYVKFDKNYKHCLIVNEIIFLGEFILLIYIKNDLQKFTFILKI